MTASEENFQEASMGRLKKCKCCQNYASPPRSHPPASRGVTYKKKMVNDFGAGTNHNCLHEQKDKHLKERGRRIRGDQSQQDIRRMIIIEPRKAG